MTSGLPYASRPVVVSIDGARMPDADKTQEFEQIMLPHLDAAYNLARWLVRNEADAEDLVQEAYLRGLRFFHSFRPEQGDGKAWLLAVVRNVCFTWLGRQRPGTSLHELDQEPEDPAERSPQRQVLSKEREGTLADCLQALPGEYREVIVLRELEELSYQQISSAAGLAIGTVMSRLSRARKRLKDCLTARLGEVR